jgi:hypothetical protein
MTGLQNWHSPSLADFDWRRFARDVRHGAQVSGQAFRPLARQIGVTLTDLSRAAGGQMVGPAKVIALCNAFGRDLMGYYVAPDHSKLNANEINVFRVVKRETSQEATL